MKTTLRVLTVLGWLALAALAVLTGDTSAVALARLLRDEE